MPSSPLPNYLRTNRKRLALSQEEVAFLLGTQSGAKVSRYENFDRVPGLETALACEAIFQKPVRELFAGLYESIEQQVAARAKALTYKTKLRKSNPQADGKRRVLAGMAAPQLKKTLKP